MRSLIDWQSEHCALATFYCCLIFYLTPFVPFVPRQKAIDHIWSKVSACRPNFISLHWNMLCHFVNGWGAIVLISVYLHVILQVGKLSETNLWHLSNMASCSDRYYQQRWRKWCDLKKLATYVCNAFSSDESKWCRVVTFSSYSNSMTE